MLAKSQIATRAARSACRAAPAPAAALRQHVTVRASAQKQQQQAASGAAAEGSGAAWARRAVVLGTAAAAGGLVLSGRCDPRRPPAKGMLP